MLQKNPDEDNSRLVERSDFDARPEHHQQPKASLTAILGKGVLQLLLMAVVLAGAFFVTQRLIATKPVPPKRPIFPTVYTVDLLTVQPGVHQPKINVYGEIVAARSVDLRSLVSGEIIRINDKLKSGGRVNRGEVLLEVDRFSFEGALREAQANIAEAQARLTEAQTRIKLETTRLTSLREQLEYAKNDLGRIEQLRKAGSATQKQVEDRRLIFSQRQQSVQQSELNIVAEEARLEQQKANVERLAWRLDQAKRNLENTKLVAPFDATVRSSTVEVGKLVSANDIVVSIYQSEGMEARFVLSDNRFSRIQSDDGGIVGRPVEITWQTGVIDHVFPGAIERIGAEISAATGGVEIFATLKPGEEDISLRPGAFVQIELPDKSYPNHYRIPETSLYSGNLVYVSVNGTLAERQVKVSAYDGNQVLIGDGLSAGDDVLVTRIAEVSAGLKVRREGDASGPRDESAESKSSVDPAASDKRQDPVRGDRQRASDQNKAAETSNETGSNRRAR